MATIPLPAHDASRLERLAKRTTKYADAMQDRLVDEHRIQVPIWSMPMAAGAAPTRFVRVSCHLYNSLEQYDYLSRAILAEIEHEMTL